MSDCEGCGAPLRGKCACDYCLRTTDKVQEGQRYAFGFSDPRYDFAARHSLLRAGTCNNDINVLRRI